MLIRLDISHDTGVEQVIAGRQKLVEYVIVW